MEYLVPIKQTSSVTAIPVTTSAPPQPAELSELRPTWGHDFCRLEYLVYLVESGRIKDC